MAPPDKPHAAHGPPSEVRWRGGQGRQPYANQGPQEAQAPNCGDQYDSGDRGARSGTTLEQMRRARGTPGETETQETPGTPDRPGAPAAPGSTPERRRPA